MLLDLKQVDMQNVNAITSHSLVFQQKRNCGRDTQGKSNMINICIVSETSSDLSEFWGRWMKEKVPQSTKAIALIYSYEYGLKKWLRIVHFSMHYI